MAVITFVNAGTCCFQKKYVLKILAQELKVFNEKYNKSFENILGK